MSLWGQISPRVITAWSELEKEISGVAERRLTDEREDIHIFALRRRN
jgi:hypothetical protein